MTIGQLRKFAVPLALLLALGAGGVFVGIAGSDRARRCAGTRAYRGPHHRTGPDRCANCRARPHRSARRDAGTYPVTGTDAEPARGRPGDRRPHKLRLAT